MILSRFGVGSWWAALPTTGQKKLQADHLMPDDFEWLLEQMLELKSSFG